MDSFQKEHFKRRMKDLFRLDWPGIELSEEEVEELIKDTQDILDEVLNEE